MWKENKTRSRKKAEIFFALCSILVKEICDPIITVTNFNKVIGVHVETGEEKRLHDM